MEWPGMALNINLYLSEDSRKALRAGSIREPGAWLPSLILIAFFGLAFLVGR